MYWSQRKFGFGSLSDIIWKMEKIKSFNDVYKLTKSFQRQGKKVALITGCFDILHIGHIDLFKFAKGKSDILIVGLDNDQSIKISKGSGRPVHKFKERASILEQLSIIDIVFKIEKTYIFGSQKAVDAHLKFIKRLNPDFIVTNIQSDKFWQRKKNLAKKLGVGILLDRRSRKSSDTKIINQLKKEN